MDRDRSTVPKWKKTLSAPSSFVKPNRYTVPEPGRDAKRPGYSTNFSSSFRKAFRLSRSSSLSSNRTSSEQSNEDNNVLCASQSAKDIAAEDKDSLMRKLQSQVKELRHKLKTLEECIENKEYSLGTIAREKDRALGEIRRLERTNKQLKQQLNDERNHYLEEKEKFCEEMTRYKKRLQEMKMNDAGNKGRGVVPLANKLSASMWQKGDSAEIQPQGQHPKSAIRANVTEFRKSNSLESVGLSQSKDFSLQMAALRTENAKLRAIINEREERNYELCLRFLRMKHSKNDLRNRFQDLENEYLQVITNLMEKIDEAREEFNFIIDKKFKKPLHSTNAKYLKMIERNSKIAFENVNLRMELQDLKKEFSKLNLGQGDYGRKTPDGERNNLVTDEKSKKSGRQTGNGTPVPKASDTDSNYMSKTSTTDPSTGSLADAKSNESISVDGFESCAKSKTPNSQNIFSEDILRKLFERVDSHSVVNTKRDLETENGAGDAVRNVDTKNRDKKKSDDQVKSGPILRPKEIPPLLEGGSGKRFIPCSLNCKKFHEVTTQFALKKTASSRKDKKGIQQQPADDVSDKDKFPEINKSRRRFAETGARPKSRGHDADAKDRVKSYPDSEKTGDSVREGTGVKATIARNRTKEKKGQDRAEGDEIRGFGTSRRYRSRKERRQRIHVRDSCGLEEKLDTDGEVSPEYNHQISGRKPRSARIVDQLATTKHETPDDIRERPIERVSHEVQVQLDVDSVSEDSAIGSSKVKMTHRNSVSLHDELMEVTKSQSHKDDPFWRRELNLHSLITEKSTSSSKTYRLNGRNSRFLSEGHTPEHVEEDDAEHPDVFMVETKVLRKDHDRERSRSPSPHQSKPGSEEGLLLDMAQKPRGSKPVDKNNEIVLQFLMPPATILSNQSFLYGKDDANKEHSSLPAKEQGSPPQPVQHQVSQFMLPTSNMTSSCTTMDMGDSSAARENGVASRTLSAPALIESEWVNTFKMCEMKDCSTNT